VRGSIQILTYEFAIDILFMRDSPVETVKVSPKYQVVIPKKVREQLQLKPGVELHVYVLDGTIRLSPPRSITELRGIAKGMRWKNEDRDHSERF
jgi:AbrB family looped-hinge helix DNA binding protein